MSLHFNKMLMDTDNVSAIWSDAPILQKVFYNENILERIFHFLPIKELTTMRLVCRTWKYESDRVLRLSPTLIVLKTETDVQLITDVMDKQKAGGSTPLFKNFLIVFDKLHLEHEAVVQFLNRHGAAFEQLSIQFYWTVPHTQNTPQSFKFLLEKQVPNLKSLQFFGFSENVWQSGELFNDSINLLPNLRDIGCISVDMYRHAWECPLYLSLFNRLPSVKKITINCSNYWRIVLEQAASHDGHQLRTFFSEVEEINTGFYDNKLLFRMDVDEYIQPIDVPNILKLMAQVCPKVKTLRLRFDSRAITNSDVGNVLNKYAGQLEELWLNVNTILDRETEDDPPENLINEFLMTPAFKKLRVIHTSVDILHPSSTVTNFFHKQLPMLETLSLFYEVPVWNTDFQHSSLRKLQLVAKTAENANCMLPIGQTFPNIKSLCIIVYVDAALRLVAQAFPNLEELSIICDVNRLSHDGIKFIGDLHHLRNLSVKGRLTDESISWLKQLRPIIFLNIS